MWFTGEKEMKEALKGGPGGVVKEGVRAGQDIVEGRIVKS